MMNTIENELKQKILYIPDLVNNNHISIIIDYFEKFDIAEVDNVYVYPHTEPEYFCEDHSCYGYGLIFIKQWYNTTVAYNFYQKLMNGNAKMVYDDPYYWDIELLSVSTDILTDKNISIVENCDTINNENNVLSNDKQDTCKNSDNDIFKFEDDVEFDKCRASNKQTIETNIVDLSQIIIKRRQKNFKNKRNTEFNNKWSRRLRLK